VPFDSMSSALCVVGRAADILDDAGGVSRMWIAESHFVSLFSINVGLVVIVERRRRNRRIIFRNEYGDCIVVTSVMMLILKSWL
jgi:hypothetical protein